MQFKYLALGFVVGLVFAAPNNGPQLPKRSAPGIDPCELKSTYALAEKFNEKGFSGLTPDETLLFEQCFLPEGWQIDDEKTREAYYNKPTSPWDLD